MRKGVKSDFHAFSFFSRTFTFSLFPTIGKIVLKDCRVVIKHPIKRVSCVMGRVCEKMILLNSDIAATGYKLNTNRHRSKNFNAKIDSLYFTPPPLS
jgi:hypothetical protein